MVCTTCRPCVSHVVGFLALVFLLSAPAHAKKPPYWKLKCPEGTSLAQRDNKLQFHCAKENDTVLEYKAGRCDRPYVLRRAKRSGFTHGCVGTTISRQGDAGTAESWAMYRCPDGYSVNPYAAKARETCKREVEGTSYRAPIFE